MYRNSCRECGAELVPHLLCAWCREYKSWICGQCGRTEDVTHVHGGLG